MIRLPDLSRLKRIVCLGAHSDDIEIGCGGTLIRLAEENPGVEVTWVVFCGADERRAAEARSSAAKYLAPFRKHQVHVGTFRDAYLPFIAAEVKDFFESLKAGESPDLILTHYREDRHQDHRLLSDLAYNTWRDHLILEYEILKYDGDLGRPNLYVTLSEDQCRRKIDFLVGEFGTQRNRQWFTEDTFWGLLRVRGVEAASPTRFAEAFYSRKMVV